MTKIIPNGSVFTRLTVRSLSETRIHGHRAYDCECICGKPTLVAGINLRNGSIRSCGCLKQLDIPLGSIFRMWEVIEKLPVKNKRVMWKCKCTKCGNIQEISCSDLRRGRNDCKCLEPDILPKTIFYNLEVVSKSDIKDGRGPLYNCICHACGEPCVIRGASLLRGIVKSCGCLQGKHNSLGKGVASFNSILLSYKTKAKIRNRTFNLSPEQFKTLIDSNCFYCGKSPSNIKRSKTYDGDYVYTSIDRVDNNRGYEIDNCVPCCAECNRMKFKHSQKIFLELIDKIYSYQKAKRDKDASLQTSDGNKISA